MLNDPELQAAFLRQIVFSLTILAIQVPLGIGIALIMPKRGWQASAVLILITLPLLIPWNVVGSIWQIFTRGDIGLMGWGCVSWALTTTLPAMVRTPGLPSS